MEDMLNYQGGGDIRLSNMVGGVFNAYTKGQEKAEAEAKERRLKSEATQADFEKNLATTMASVNPKGLQQADIPGFQKIYSEMEDFYIQAAQEKDPTKRTLALAKMKASATRATLYAQQSEESGKRQLAQQKTLLDQYGKYRAEDAKKAMDEYYSKPFSERTGDFDLLPYRNKWDSPALTTSLEKMKKDLLSSAPITPTEKIVSSAKNGYDTVNTFQISKTIPQEVAVAEFRKRYATDDNFKRYVDTDFDGPLESKFAQLYQNLGPSWSTSTTEDRRVAGRAPKVSSSGSGGSGGSGGGSTGGSGVNVGVDIAYSGENVAVANKQMAFKGNGIKARLSKGVRAYDMDTGDVVDVTTGMQDGVIMEVVNLPTGDVKGMGRRVLVKGTEHKFQEGRRDEDFAVVRYKEPQYVLAGDSDNIIFKGSKAKLQEGLKKGTVVKGTSFVERTALFPLNSVMPQASTLTKGENMALSEYHNTKVTPSTPQMSSSVSKLLNRK